MCKICVFACAFCACVHPSSACVCVCFSVLLWDCRTTSRVLNNESKHGRGAKSHCSSLSLCTAFTSAELEDWSLKSCNRAKTLLSPPQPRSSKPQNSLWYVVKYKLDHRVAPAQGWIFIIETLAFITLYLWIWNAFSKIRGRGQSGNQYKTPINMHSNRWG